MFSLEACPGLKELETTFFWNSQEVPVNFLPLEGQVPCDPDQSFKVFLSPKALMAANWI